MSTSVTGSAVSLSGLASGIDWTSLVSQLVEVERAPETALRTTQSKLQTQNNAYQSLGTQMTTLQDSISDLLDPSTFDSRATNLSNSTVASATAADGAALGTYTFNITSLATDAVLKGTAATAQHLSPTDDVSSLVVGTAGFGTAVKAGTFTVNGKAITIAATDTLKSVFDQISSATGGAVTASYSSATDEISLNSTSPIVLGSVTDTSNFLQVSKLYNNGTGAITSTSALGSLNLTNKLSSANLSTPITDGGSGAGAFAINGVTINYNSSTDAISDVLNRINNSAAGVTATYDTINNRFLLTNKTTGDVGISMQDVTGNFLAATGLSAGTLQRGTNAQYSINGGGNLVSQSNIITSDSSGLSGLTLTALTTGTTTVSVSSNTTKISNAITNLVNEYNAAQKYITSQVASSTDSSGTVTAGTLSGQTDVEGIATQLRHILMGAPGGLTGAVQTLNSLGIVSNGNDNTLSISNPTALTNALTNNLDAVKKLFTDPTSGLATQLNTYLDNVNGDNGLIATKEASLTSQSTDIDDTIAQMERKISDDQDRLNAEFVAMETAESTINTQKQYLTSAFGGSSSSSSG